MPIVEMKQNLLKVESLSYAYTFLVVKTFINTLNATIDRRGGDGVLISSFLTPIN